MVAGGEQADSDGAPVMNVSVHQLYYTSCRRGLSGYAGFQTRAESNGLQLEERREIEGKALYKPPRDLPREPDADTIAAQFPKAFKMVKLSSGRTALIHAVYTGQDYSGRWGNYFAHALVFDGVLEGQWAIDAYAWPGWVEGLPDGYDENEPKPLPAVPLGDIASGTDFSFDELKTFLSESEGRAEMLSRMLCAAFQRATDSRSIVIRESLELDGVYWIACIQKAFPPSCQRELTFSTFQFDPRSSLAINATIGETDFLFDEGERKYQFYVFDFITGEHSAVPGEHTEYARVISAWMASDPHCLESFHEFAALFDYQEIGPGLLHILRLYRLEGGDAVGLTTTELHSVLEFVRARALPAAFARVLGVVGDATRDLGATAPPEDWVLVIRFLTEGAAATGQPEHRRRACQAWVDAFDHFVVEQQRDEEVVLALRGEVEEKLGANAGDVGRAFLSGAHLDWLWEQVARLSGKGLGIVMTEVERSCRQLGGEPTYQAQEVRTLIEAVLYRNPGRPQDLQWAFAPYMSQIEGLASIVEHVVAVLTDQVLDGYAPRETWRTACRAVGRSLSAVFGVGGDGLRFTLLNRLKVDERFADVLLGEWEACIEQATDKIEAHAYYERNILSDDSKFAVKMREEYAVALLKVLPQEHQRRQARRWVESGRCCWFSDDVAGTVFALASQDVRLSPEDQISERLASQISEQLSARRLTLESDRLELRTAVCRALSEPDGTNGLHDILRRVDAESYGEFVGIVLPRLLGDTHTPGGHRKVVLSMAIETQLSAFGRAYTEFLTQRSGDRFDQVDVAAIVFWLTLTESDSAWPVLGRLKKPAIDAMASRLGSMRGRIRSKAEVYLKRRHELRERRVRKELEAFLDRTDKLRLSWLDRLLGRSRAKR